MRRLLLPFGILMSLVTGLSTHAFAQWPTGLSTEVFLGGGYFGTVNGRMVPGDGPTDFYAVFEDRGSAGGVWRVAHLDVLGGSKWPGRAVELHGQAARADVNGPSFAPTGHGGIVNAWFSPGLSNSLVLRLSHSDSTGVLLPAASPFGVTVATYPSLASGSFPVTCSRRDGGGAYVGWAVGSIRLLRVDESGNPAPGWPATGWAVKPNIALGGWPDDLPPAMEPDGSGGLLFATGGESYSNPSPMRVYHLSGDTTSAPGWSSAGLPLTGLQQTYRGSEGAIRIVRADSTHAIVVWSASDVDWTEHDLYCQRFSLEGEVDPAWPADGVPLASLPNGSSFQSVQAVPDGAGGVTVGWAGGGGYKIIHVSADGGFPGDYANAYKTVFTTFYSPAIASGIGDGVVVIFPDLTGIRARWLDGSGRPLHCDTSDSCSVRVAAHWSRGVFGALADGHGGAYYDWVTGSGDYYLSGFVSHTDFPGIPTPGIGTTAPAERTGAIPPTAGGH